MTVQRYFLLAAVLGVTACTDDSLAPGAGDDPGSGTGTLQVHCGIGAAPEANADGPTNFVVHVLKDGARVDGADVTITSSSGAIKLVNDLSGRYDGKTSVYDEVYVLDVSSGDDNLRGVPYRRARHSHLHLTGRRNLRRLEPTGIPICSCGHDPWSAHGARATDPA
jgi:hypothetical protein